jgi:hypothetical protein
VATEPGFGAAGPSARTAGAPAEIGAALAVETAQAMANPIAQVRLGATRSPLRGFMVVALS